jgi:Nucleotidyl transferase
MPKPKVLALVMAGGEGNRLELLTERRAKPALPFAGVYRLIDFPLDPARPLDLDDPAWPVLGRAPQRLPARVPGDATVPPGGRFGHDGPEETSG